MSADPPLAELLRDGFRWFGERLSERLTDGEPMLSPGAGLLMSQLGPDGIGPSELARRMRVSRQHVHTTARELTAAGLVVVEPDPGSRRDKLIRLTALGRDRQSEVRILLRQLDEEVEQRLGTADLDRLRGLLARLVDR